jgi:hypothetical protein
MWSDGRWTRVLLLISGAVLMGLSACGSGSRPGAPPLGGPSGDASAAGAPSVESVVETAQRSLRAGGVLHQKVTEALLTAARALTLWQPPPAGS